MFEQRVPTEIAIARLQQRVFDVIEFRCTHMLYLVCDSNKHSKIRSVCIVNCIVDHSSHRYSRSKRGYKYGIGFITLYHKRRNKTSNR